MAVTLEPCKGNGYTLRAGPPHKQHGDPYTAAGTVDLVGDLATVRGFIALHPLALGEYLAMRGPLRAIGARWVRIERRDGDKVTDREWRL